MSYAPPRWSTPRTPGRPTYGPAIARAAQLLGKPLLPWQRDVADVIGEVLPDGRMAYPVVVLIVPRRAGKTVLELAVKTQRAASIPGCRSWYTAQTGGDAGKKFRKDWVPAFKGSRILSRQVTTRLSNGSESITFKRTGGTIGIFAPTETALHGEDSDDATVDEAWAFDLLRGRQLEAAIRPTMATRPLRQLRIVSAGGTADSTWLLGWRELGRATSGLTDQGIAYFEWHPAVDELGEILDDLDDPATWAATHPSVGYGIPLDVLVEDRKSTDGEQFYRSFLDVFTGASTPRILPRAEWTACREPELSVPTGYGLTLAYDVSPDQLHASIALANRLPDGRVGVEVVDVSHGDDPDAWLADRVDQLAERYRPQLCADSVGPATPVTRELRARGRHVHELDTREAVDSCAGLLSDVLAARDRRTGELRPGRVAHRGQRPLDDAVDVAAKREVGDGWMFTRKGSSGDVTPATAAAFAIARAKLMPRGELGPLVEFAQSTRP